jgi:hypothetical protein
MKNTQEAVVFIRKTAETVVDRVNHQVKQIVRLVTKQPKKPPLSWESIIGEFPSKSRMPVVVKSSKRLELPEVNQQLVQLPQETFDELLGQIQMNTLDEIKAIRLYEKLFDCEIRILRGHVHFYKCKRHKKEETIDYTTLTGRLLQLFIEHKEIISDASGVRY